jgi:pyocin large subunit-like protein
MSLRAMAWAWQQQTRSSGERLVLLALADHAGEDCECWPHTARLGEKCGIDARTVQRHLASLCDRGLVTKVHRRKRADGTLAGWLYRVEVTSADTTSTSGLRHDTDVESMSRHARQVSDTTSTSSHEPSSSNHHNEPSQLVRADEFEVWWEMYPRKTSKQASHRAWSKLTVDDRRAALAALPAHIQYWVDANTSPQFIPHPATWLNGRRWDDVLPAITDTGRKQAPGMSMIRQLLEGNNET